MANITHFVNFMKSVDKFKVNAPEKVGYVIRPLIDDIIFDVQERGKIVTERIYEAAANALQIPRELDTAKLIVNDFVIWLKKDRKNLVNEEFDCDFEEFVLDETELFPIDENDQIDERNARAPKLRGIQLKKRKAKAEIMSKLNKVPAYISAQQKLLQIANREAKKLAREAGIKPNLVDVSKVIVRKSSVDSAKDKKVDSKTSKD